MTAAQRRAEALLQLKAHIAAATPEQQAQIKARAHARYIAKRDIVLARTKLWKEQHPERRRELSKIYYQRHKLAVRKRLGLWWSLHPDYRRCHNWFKRYGVTAQQYAELQQQCDNRCSICRKAETRQHFRSKTPSLLSVDHDHATGKIRGLLCHDCNRALGQFHDDIGILKAAISYLSDHLE